MIEERKAFDVFDEDRNLRFTVTVIPGSDTIDVVDGGGIRIRYLGRDEAEMIAKAIAKAIEHIDMETMRERLRV